MGANHSAVKNDARYKQARIDTIERDKVCQHCGTDQNLSLDHIVPLNEGGHPFDLSNTQALCVPCNSRKKDKPNPLVRVTWINPRWSALLEVDAAPADVTTDPVF